MTTGKQKCFKILTNCEKCVILNPNTDKNKFRRE